MLEMLNKGADCTAKDQNGKTLLHLACAKGTANEVKQLLVKYKDSTVEKGLATENNDGNTPLHIIAASEDRDQSAVVNILDIVSKYKPNINIQNSQSHATPIHLACITVMPAVVQKLFSMGANIPQHQVFGKHFLRFIVDEINQINKLNDDVDVRKRSLDVFRCILQQSEAAKYREDGKDVLTFIVENGWAELHDEFKSKFASKSAKKHRKKKNLAAQFFPEFDDVNSRRSPIPVPVLPRSPEAPAVVALPELSTPKKQISSRPGSLAEFNLMFPPVDASGGWITWDRAKGFIKVYTDGSAPMPLKLR